MRVVNLFISIGSIYTCVYMMKLFELNYNLQNNHSENKCVLVYPFKNTIYSF